MEPAAEPPTKRQRKEPAWKAGFVDPSKWKDLKDGLVAPLVVREIDGQQVQPAANASPSGTGGGEEEGASQILSCRPIDFNCVEVTVLHKGRRYRGILERTALPPGIGVSTQGATAKQNRRPRPTLEHACWLRANCISSPSSTHSV
ncbi:hypothetical protein Vafri_633 [Volvox africanus]|nr:hypothetical protein Vafri_633 [Volvox africanus]